MWIGSYISINGLFVRKKPCHKKIFEILRSLTTLPNLLSKISAYANAALLTHIAEGNEIGVGAAAAAAEMLDSHVPFEKDPFAVVCFNI